MEHKLHAQIITTDAEKGKALEIRRKVFIEEQGVPADIEYDRYDAMCRHYLAFIDGEPAGTARWRETGEGIKLERFAVLKPFRNKGLAQHILKVILADLKGQKAKIYLHAQLAVVPFYEKEGFKKSGDIFREAGIDHIAMYYKNK